MKTIHDLSALSWTVSGWTPFLWRFSQTMEVGASSIAEIQGVPAAVPGSVQHALRQAGMLPDWNAGFNARQCEWVENRHWIFETDLPDEWLKTDCRIRLNCLGLDYAGWILINGKEAGEFCGSMTPHDFDLTGLLAEKGNRLAIVFDCPPRWLGQFGYTSRMTDWKPRFNYTWDWTARLVQTGIWDDIHLEVSDGNDLESLRCETSVMPAGGKGKVTLQGAIGGDAIERVWVTLTNEGEAVLNEEISRARFEEGYVRDDLAVAFWHPNGSGEQPLYRLTLVFLDGAGEEVVREERVVGFKTVEWQPCEGAPPEADPWICVVNGRPLFLQGVNWTPIRPNFADLTEDDYRLRLTLYRDLGCNVLRVWGGAYLEKECFYRICDELGLLVWQEFPLSSSGVENWPPEDEKSIAELEKIAASYIERRRHHVSLFVWCGGNELQGAMDGGKIGTGKPVDGSHPLMRRFSALVKREDPTRRFLPTSSSGPRFTADRKEFGAGLHWDVHGPWLPAGALDGEWTLYWKNDDALFRSETGAPGASPPDIIREFLGECEAMPPSIENPIWRRTAWWIEWPEFLRQGGSPEASLEDYVAWSQQRQATALEIAAGACKERFPRCGGFLVWMGHDSFPCCANTAIIDYHGRPKPAALALAEIFRGENQVP